MTFTTSTYKFPLVVHQIENTQTAMMTILLKRLPMHKLFRSCELLTVKHDEFATETLDIKRSTSIT